MKFKAVSLLLLQLFMYILVEVECAYSFVNSSLYTNFTFVANNLLVNNQLKSTKGQYLWGLSYAPYTVICPSTSLIRTANNVCNHLTCFKF